MSKQSAGTEIERLVALLARLPGLGHRSARKAALTLLKKRTDCWSRWLRRSTDAASQDRRVPQLRQHRYRQPLHDLPGPAARCHLIVVVEEIGDLWALERAGVVSGLYHVLGGHLSPLDGIGPERSTSAA
jgi:recombination protein RecR